MKTFTTPLPTGNWLREFFVSLLILLSAVSIGNAGTILPKQVATDNGNSWLNASGELQAMTKLAAGHGYAGYLLTDNTDGHNSPLRKGDKIDSDVPEGGSHRLRLRIHEQELSFSPDANRIIYVKKGSTGNGSSWENAAGEFADALKWAHDNNSLWAQGIPLKIYVAKGTYNPLYKVAETDLENTPTTDRDNAFVMVKNVQLYGGFDPDNGAVDLEHRRLADKNATILSGDLNSDDAADVNLQSLLTHPSRLDNAYHVVLSVNDAGSACLDGFTIAGGNGDKDGLAVPISGQQIYRGFGAGISLWYSSPVIRNVIVRENSVRQSGAGIYTMASEPILTDVTMTRNAANQNGGGMSGNYYGPKLMNVRFQNNWAKYYGGGFYDYQLNAKLTNVVFQHNAADYYGGAVYSFSSSSEYINVSIHTNVAGDRAGAMFNRKSSLRLTNLTVAKNSGTSVGGIYNSDCSPKFVNCIIWENTKSNGSIHNILNDSPASVPEYRYSLVQGSGGSLAWQSTFGLDKGNNLDADPTFTDATSGDFSLADGSSAIGAGSNEQYNSAGGNIATDTDPAGNPRFSGTTIDLGAFERQEPLPIRYVRQGGTGRGRNWETASGDLQTMINQSASGNEIWVAAGEYQPRAGEHFAMKEGVKIYGGFAATGNPAFADRNWTQLVTILKGNGNSVIVNDNNGLTNAAQLDGFTITGGSAATGGGMLNHLAYPLINRCVFKGNHATVWGGGVYNDGPGMTNIVNSLIYHNTAQSGAGAFSYQNARPRFTNVTVVGNTADQNGGALHNYEGAETEFVNCIVWGNSQGSGSSQLYTAGQGKTKAYFSVLEGGAEAIIGDRELVDIVSEDPLFADLANGDFTLQRCSPALNLGTAGVLHGFTTDLIGNDRLYGIVDAGAYEYQAAVPTGADRLSVNGHTTSVNVTAGQTYTVQAADDACLSVAVITSNGVSPLNGVVNVTVHIDPAVQTHNGSPYVQRHYEISPVEEASATTARITLYFTRSEFTAYNTRLGRNALPVSPGDDLENVRVFQYHGTPRAEQSGPGAYNGAPVSIIPDVNWNAGPERWELSFDVNGFSGFFVGSSDAALPVKLITFEGNLSENNAIVLQWRVTKQERMAEYLVEYSTNALDFSEIGSVPASVSADSDYRFTDARPDRGSIAYYRLKMLETDATFSRSRIISVLLPENDLLVYPVPARNFIRIKGKGVSGTSLTLTNAQGIVLKTIACASDNQEIELAPLPAGIYFIRTESGYMQKIVKE